MTLVCNDINLLICIIPESEDDEFTRKDAFLLGGAMGWGYEEGLEERKRRKLEKEMDSEKDRQDQEDDI